MAHTKFILSIDKVLNIDTRQKIFNELRVVEEYFDLKLREEVLEPKETLVIKHDSDSSNPRGDDNIGTMHCAGHYGDTDAEDPRTMKPDEFAIRIPIYMYQHGGTTISHTPFSCQWDSAQCGVHYITKKRADKEWGAGKWSVEQLQAVLACELEVYDHYLQGNAWGFQIENEDGDITESCWGFFGDKLEETGILDHLPQDLHAAAEIAWDRRYD